VVSLDAHDNNYNLFKIIVKSYAKINSFHSETFVFSRSSMILLIGAFGILLNFILVSCKKFYSLF